MKKPRVAFCIADDEHKWMLDMFVNSLRKFHTEEELPLIVYGQKELDAIDDSQKFYRATPLFARKLIDKYDVVIKFDVDQIVTGKLNYIWERDDYDVGVVINFSRADLKVYGPVTVLTIPPTEYVNCGLVAMRNKEFVDHWWHLCNTDHFHKLQYREQDMLNIMIHFGRWKVRCFDRYDPVHNYAAWHGLLSKGEWHRTVLVDGELILPKAEDGHPNRDTTLKLLHWAGGKDEKKMNYRPYFTEEVIAWLDKLIKPKKGKGGKKET